jgi:hypothetical protein
LLILEIEEGAHRPGGLHEDVASPPSIPAVGSPLRNVLFTPKADAAFPAVARLDLDPCEINKHGVHPMTDHRRRDDR